MYRWLWWVGWGNKREAVSQMQSACCLGKKNQNNDTSNRVITNHVCHNCQGQGTRVHNAQTLLCWSAELCTRCMSHLPRRWGASPDQTKRRETERSGQEEHERQTWNDCQENELPKRIDPCMAHVLWSDQKMNNSEKKSNLINYPTAAITIGLLGSATRAK